MTLPNLYLQIWTMSWLPVAAAVPQSLQIQRPKPNSHILLNLTVMTRGSLPSCASQEEWAFETEPHCMIRLASNSVCVSAALVLTVLLPQLWNSRLPHHSGSIWMGLLVFDRSQASKYPEMSIGSKL